ncbi:amidohydrolase family protein [Terrimonas sp. NA20]|uniref:Amidohydrolase family protein n=1 Tax=Terrimonas ginsenosidimutans TaxID=2908004 RepID=A0ABS9KRA7_9BACT|nr:amidohydrolase family protein [Terrimonas ginsenosidimutans]MCG2614845.1 amidohydrolase family protein [Terrimonas ginsenosidimutans]
MKMLFRPVIAIAALFTVMSACNNPAKNTADKSIILHDVTLIDGKGTAPQEHIDIRMINDSIVDVGRSLDTNGATVIRLGGKTVMPSLISAHVHIGALKGTATKPEFYTRGNIISQLNKYQDYGILNILVMGTDRPLLFETGIRDSSLAGNFPGARIHSAGYGFGVPGGAPPLEFAMDRVFRPETPAQVSAQMDSLAALKPEVVKLWLDDFGGKFRKMDPAVYKAVIDEAHKHQLRVASHAYYVSDARQLVNEGVDIIAHSIRDSVTDDALVSRMKSKGIIYIPTLSLDEFSFIYAGKPEWIDDPFFKTSLEPGVYEMITDEKYQSDLKKSPAYARNMKGFDIALKNLKKLHDAGVLVALGTDSGAMPLRAQGFSEHLELELMVQAGLSPLQAITAATGNAAKAMKIDGAFGTIEKGKIADLLIIDGDPLKDIRQTRQIFAVYKAGKEVSKGPLSK